MMKKAVLFILLLSLIMLTGCQSPDAAPVITPTSAPTAAPTAPASSHPLYQTARDVLSPYQECLNRIRQDAPYCISHTIPEDMFLLLAQFVEQRHISPEGGRYSFTATEESIHTYQATAMEVALQSDAETTPDPADETPMDVTRMGDYSVQGGGKYQYTYIWDAAQDLSQGRVEIKTLLNGEEKGYEVFSFCLRPDGFFFVDAAADVAATLDALESSGQYLVALGCLTENRIDLVEYHIPSLADMPAPEIVNLDSVKLSVTPLSSLIATKDSVTLAP